MLWVGIGLIIIGIAFFGLVILLVKPLNKLANIFNSLQKTTDQLPQNINEVITEAKEAIESGKDTLHEVNEQLRELSPMLHIIGDASRATNHLSSSMVDAVMKLETSTSEASEFTHRNRLEGLYGALTLGYFIFQKGKAFSNERNIVDER